MPYLVLDDPLNDRQIIDPNAGAVQRFYVLSSVQDWVGEPEHSRITSTYFGGNSFIITPPFSPSAI